MGFKKWAAYGILAAGATLFLSAAFTVVSILYGMSWSDVTAPPLLGNRPEVISRLTDGQPDVRPFSFLIVGDTQSKTIFENFFLKVALDVAPDFGVVVGDFVANPEMNRHRFFMGEFGEWNMTFPVFLIAGNHDIVTNHETGLDWLRDPVYEKDFEKLYGPANFSFIYRGCLFIGLNDVYTIDYFDYVKDVLSHRPPDILMTFVFMHIAPKSLSPLLQTRQMEGEEEFKRLMETYDVDYVLAGDFHSYLRMDRNNTEYIITGGGGATLHGGARSFHHAVLMTVDPARDRADETIYSFRPTLDVGDDIEIAMICGIYPVFEQHPLGWVALFTLIAAAAAGLVAFLLVRITRKRRGLRRIGA
ncbi:MAG: metallophosphoesterase [Deltaproteobacteria bacterium]|nr:metallophosphoesterase [Candidatus Zymogenaceae bacterium]